MKYEITNEANGAGLRRIKALKDFDSVESGDLGGWIEKESNLSQEDNCWVWGDAQVCGNAQVYGNAWAAGGIIDETPLSITTPSGDSILITKKHCFLRGSQCSPGDLSKVMPGLEILAMYYGKEEPILISNRRQMDV